MVTGTAQLLRKTAQDGRLKQCPVRQTGAKPCQTRLVETVPSSTKVTKNAKKLGAKKPRVRPSTGAGKQPQENVNIFNSNRKKTRGDTVPGKKKPAANGDKPLTDCAKCKLLGPKIQATYDLWFKQGKPGVLGTGNSLASAGKFSGKKVTKASTPATKAPKKAAKKKAPRVSRGIGKDDKNTEDAACQLRQVQAARNDT